MKKVILLFAVATVVLGAIGCSGGGDDAAASSTTPAGDTTPSTANVDPTKGGGPAPGPEPTKPPGG